jgi:hypothetical protein
LFIWTFQQLWSIDLSDFCMAFSVIFGLLMFLNLQSSICDKKSKFLYTAIHLEWIILMWNCLLLRVPLFPPSLKLTTTISHNPIKLVIYLQQICGFLWILVFPASMQLTTMITQNPRVDYLVVAFTTTYAISTYNH